MFDLRLFDIGIMDSVVAESVSRRPRSVIGEKARRPAKAEFPPPNYEAKPLILLVAAIAGPNVPTFVPTSVSPLEGYFRPG
jgi:hypothetical protein